MARTRNLPTTARLGHLPRACIGMAAAALLAGLALTAPAAADSNGRSFHNDPGGQPMRVAVDEARLLRLNRMPGTIVVGNPLIADVAVHDDGLVVVVGKNYGTTNLIALDEAGEELAHFDIAVRTSGVDSVSLYRGTDRYSLNCSPRCEYELDVGDEFEHFDGMQKSITSKMGLSQDQLESQQ